METTKLLYGVAVQKFMLLSLTSQDYYHVTKHKLVTEAKDNKSRSNYIELLLAEILIKRVLGEDWWWSASNEIYSWIKCENAETPMQHPLSRFLTAGKGRFVPPESSVQLVRFAADLLTLLDQPETNMSLEAKLSELKSSSFFETWFEIRVAGVFIRKGMRAILISPSTKEKRPDIEVDYKGNKFEVECKFRRRLSIEERSSEEKYHNRMEARLSNTEELILNASRKFKSVPSLVAINVDIPSSSAGLVELERLKDKSERILNENQIINAVLFFVDRVDYDYSSDKIGLQTQLCVIKNNNPIYSLPDEIFQTLLSREVDSRPKMEILAQYALAH